MINFSTMVALLRRSLIILFLFGMSAGYGQVLFKEGYVVLNSQDTVKGWVAYKEGAAAYQGCQFKPTSDGAVTLYAPNQILGYGITNDKVFFSKSVPPADSVAVFFEGILYGHVSLYQYQGTYYLQKEGGELVPLLNERSLTTVDGKTVEKLSRQYIGSLNMLLFDCEKIRSKISQVKLDEIPLINLLADYHKCKGKRFVNFKSKKKATKVTFGAVVGAQISGVTFEVRNPSFDHLAEPFKKSTAPIFGLTLNLNSNKVGNPFSFELGLFYVSTSYTSFSEVQNLSSTTREYVSIDLQNLKIPLGMKYEFSGHRMLPYVMGGVSYTSHLKTDSEWITEIDDGATVSTTTRYAVEEKKYQIGGWAGVGIKPRGEKRIVPFLETRFEYTNGTSGVAANATSRITNIQFLLGMSF